MSKWIFSPDADTIYHFKRTSKSAETYSHIGYLKLINDTLEVKDLLTNSTYFYDIKDEIVSCYITLDTQTSLTAIEKIKQFLSKCNDPKPFIQYFSEDINNIYNRNIRILSLLNLADFNFLLFSEDSHLAILKELKEKWITAILQSKADAIAYIDLEIKKLDKQNEEHYNAYREAYLETRLLAENFDYMSELNDISTIDELIEYWPTLFLPAPPFVNDLYHSFN